MQYPGWILTSDGSIVITTANDDAVGVYTCTPYNSYGTMGQSERTAVMLQVRLSGNETKKRRLSQTRVNDGMLFGFVPEAHRRKSIE